MFSSIKGLNQLNQSPFKPDRLYTLKNKIKETGKKKVFLSLSSEVTLVKQFFGGRRRSTVQSTAINSRYFTFPFFLPGKKNLVNKKIDYLLSSFL